MGEVYRGQDGRLGREVAIKVLPQRFSGQRDALSRFEREARAVAALSHPGILTLFDVGREGDVAYAVTELLEGETLRARLSGTPLPWQAAVQIAATVAEALSAAHARGVIHRDLKPENIFLTADGRVKVLDFGLARVKIEARSSFEGSVAETVGIEEAGGLRTEAGSVLGTVGYMSPEQLRGEPADAPSDIFALGCTLYEMLAGRRPFAGSTAAEVVASALKDAPPDLASRGLPHELVRAVEHALEKRPERRFQSARDLAFALRSLLEDATVPRTSSDARRKTVESIAVLPLANASRDPEAEYLSDGVTDTLVGLLSRLPDLRVIARSVTARYKADDVDPIAAGRALGVGTVLAGRILARGDRLVVNVELIEVADGSRLWGERLSHRLADILDVEEAIARQIAERLKLKLSGKEDLQLARRGTGSGEAYREYLKGRFQWAKRTDEGCRRAIEHYDRAIEIDPTYALAYGGIADAHNIQGFMCYGAPRDVFSRARAAARRALELDPGLVEAKASLGYVTHYLDWDFAKAEAEYRTAIAERGDYATAHLYLSNVLTLSGRFAEAAEAQRRALEIEPLALILNAAVAWTLYFSGRFEEAAAQFRRTLDMDPGFVPALLYLGANCAESPGAPDAVAVLRRAVDASGGATICRAFLAHAYAAAGDRDAATRLLGELAGTNDRYVPSYDLAAVHAALGEREDAFRRLERAFEERSHRLTFLRVDPRFRLLTSDERFESLARRVGIPHPA